MKVLHITSITHPQGNGVAVAVSNFIKYQSELTEVAIYNIESDIDEKNVISFNYNKYKSISSLPSGFSNPDLVVFNEVYKKVYIFTKSENDRFPNCYFLRIDNALFNIIKYY